jgi:hypothetical protein
MLFVGFDSNQNHLNSNGFCPDRWATTVLTGVGSPLFSLGRVALVGLDGIRLIQLLQLHELRSDTKLTHCLVVFVRCWRRLDGELIFYCNSRVVSVMDCQRATSPLPSEQNTCYANQ